MLIARGLAVARLRVSILRYLLDLDPVGLSGILAHAVRGSDRRETCPAFPKYALTVGSHALGDLKSAQKIVDWRADTHCTVHRWNCSRSSGSTNSSSSFPPSTTS